MFTQGAVKRPLQRCRQHHQATSRAKTEPRLPQAQAMLLAIVKDVDTLPTALAGEAVLRHSALTMQR